MAGGPTLDTPLNDAAWLNEFNTDTSTANADSAAASAANAAANASSAKPEVAHSWAAAAAAAAAAVQPSPLRIGGRFAKRSNSDSVSADDTAAATTTGTAAGDAGGVLVLAATVASDVKAESQLQQQSVQPAFDTPTAGVLPQVSFSTVIPSTLRKL
jgi:hypothetical protein